MPNLFVIACGGGGIGIFDTWRAWLDAQQASQLVDSKIDPEAWLYGRQEGDGDNKELTHGIGMVFSDSYSPEMQQRQGRPPYKGRIYQLSNQPGMEQDPDEAKSQLEQLRSRPPSSGHLVGNLNGAWGVGRAHAIMPVFSLDGGSGRGTLEFLVEHQKEYKPDQNVVSIPFAVLPYNSDLHNEKRLANTLSAIDSLWVKVQRGPRDGEGKGVDYAFVCCNEMCLFQYAADEGRPIRDEMRKALRQAFDIP